MTTQQELTPELIRAALTTVKFPGFSRDIVSFGLVKKIDIDAENNVTIDLVIESKNADIPRYIFEGVHGVMKHLPGVKHCDVNIEHKAPEARKGINDDPSTWKSSVPGAKHVIAVASGKGGVGKSTVSANLAVALSKLGYSVGLVDLDIYGPSMSLMFGTKERPGANENDEFIPVTAHGVKLLSMGLLINESDPVAVRGPQLTIVQTAELDGVVVTTPQEVALIDARKAIGLFERVETPILGIIENMSYFQCPSDGKMYHIFGEGGGEREAARLGVPLLGKIPLDISTRSGGDEGRPVALEEPGQNPVSAAFRQVAEQCARVVLDR